jgi:hypothetical protein
MNDGITIYPGGQTGIDGTVPWKNTRKALPSGFLWQMIGAKFDVTGTASAHILLS